MQSATDTVSIHGGCHGDTNVINSSMSVTHGFCSLHRRQYVSVGINVLCCMCSALLEISNLMDSF